MTPDQQVTRALDAQQVLENPVFVSAMEQMRDEIIAQWKACPVRDKEGQTLLLQLAKLSDKFEGILRGYIETGKLAQHKINVDSARDEGILRQWARKRAA